MYLAHETQVIRERLLMIGNGTFTKARSSHFADIGPLTLSVRPYHHPKICKDRLQTLKFLESSRISHSLALRKVVSRPPLDRFLSHFTCEQL